MYGKLGNSNYMVIMHVLAPRLKLWNGRNGRSGRSGKLSHCSDVIGTCICSNVDLHVYMYVWLCPLWVHGQWQCCYGSCLSIIKNAGPHIYDKQFRILQTPFHS